MHPPSTRRRPDPTHLCSQLRQLLVHAAPSPQLVLQILRHAAQLVLMDFLQQVQLQSKEIFVTQR